MRRTHPHSDPWYDIFDDFQLIEASFAKQYGIRLKEQVNKMSWDEFRNLLSGLMPNTPLGRVVSIRSENDKEVLKGFTSDMRRERSQYRAKIAKNMEKDEVQLQKDFDELERMMEAAFGENSK